MMLRWTECVVILGAVGLYGCVDSKSAGGPMVEAHRGGAGYWPANSITAVEGAIASGCESIEIDLFLAGDLVPVLSAYPFLDETTCTTVDGAWIDERVWLYTMRLDDLQADYLCGAVPDPSFPGAAVDPAPLATLDDLIDVLESDPDLNVHLDMQYHPNVSHEPEVFAAEVMERWWAAGLPNPLTVTADRPETLAAFDERASQVDVTLTTGLNWPWLPPVGSTSWVALWHELITTIGFEDAVAEAVDAGADGISIPVGLLQKRWIERAHQEGITVLVGPVNDPKVQETMSRWGVDTISTDYPELQP